MIGLIIAVSVLGALFVSYAVYSFIQMYRMTKNMDALAECFLAVATHPDDVDIIETYDIKDQNTKCAKSDWNFPNTEGGFQ